MKHVITFEQTDILDFIRQMLAMRGVKPRTKEGTELLGFDHNEDGDLEITIECDMAPPPELCPLCQRKLKTEPEEELPKPKPELVKEKPAEVKLDEDLGESLEPPVIEGAAEPEHAASIGSLMAASKRIIDAKKRTETSRPKMMPGESTTPPKGE